MFETCHMQRARHVNDSINNRLCVGCDVLDGARCTIWTLTQGHCGAKRLHFGRALVIGHSKATQHVLVVKDLRSINEESTHNVQN